MRKNQVQRVIVRAAPKPESLALAEKISRLHAEIIERELEQSPLSVQEKITVLDQIIADLKARESDGLIR